MRKVMFIHSGLLFEVVKVDSIHIKEDRMQTGVLRLHRE
jgi:hypothetical protein